MPDSMTKTEFAELLRIGNDQLVEVVRSHIMAIRAETNRRLDDLNGRLDALEAWLRRRAEYAAYKAYHRPRLQDGVERLPTPAEAWDQAAEAARQEGASEELAHQIATAIAKELE